MCLAIPARVIELTPPEMAVVDIGGVRRPVNISMVDAELGDYLIVHVGFAISKIDPQSARESYESFLEVAEAMEDAELKATIEQAMAGMEG